MSNIHPTHAGRTAIVDELEYGADLVKQSAELTPKSNVNRYECSGCQKTNDDAVIKLACSQSECSHSLWSTCTVACASLVQAVIMNTVQAIDFLRP